MNMFASLAEPMQCRPGDYIPEPPKPVKAKVIHTKRVKAPRNPWGLPNREWQVLAAVAEFGSNDEAAHELGISAQTVSVLMLRAKKRMGAKTRLLAVLTWDRFVRSQGAA